jgi:hypothetical protein
MFWRKLHRLTLVYRDDVGGLIVTWLVLFRFDKVLKNPAETCDDMSHFNFSRDAIDDSHYRLILKLGKEMQITHHSSKEHTKISKIATFGCEML